MQYRLCCIGALSPEWLAGFLALFDAQGVNIRKLLVMELFDESGMTRLEVEFTLAEGQADFIEVIRQQVEAARCGQPVLSPV